MISLVIDTATENGFIALFQQEKLLAEAHPSKGLKNSAVLMPEIDRLCKKETVEPWDITFITVGIGPGSYTGIRVGAVVAKMIALTNDIPLVGVSSLKAYQPKQECVFATLFDARIGGVYLIKGIKKENGVEWTSEPTISPLTSISGELKGVSRIITPHMLLKDKISFAGKWEFTKPNPEFFGMEGLKKFLTGSTITDGNLTLLYLRKTQAELEKE